MRHGLAAFDAQLKRKSQFKAVGGTLIHEQGARLETEKANVARELERFAAANKVLLASNDALRQEFACLCVAVDLDPLVLYETGDSQDWRLKLGVRVIEKCRKTKQATGGLLTCQQLRKTAPGETPISESMDSVKQAIAALRPLGNGLKVERLPNGSEIIRSVPRELSTDQAALLVACDALGYVTHDILRENLGWRTQRSEQIISDMMSTGLLWVDLQAVPTAYWTPSSIF